MQEVWRRQMGSDSEIHSAHKPIYILTGPIRNGKTTALMHWLAGKKNVAGILTPDLNGVRKLYDIGTQEYFPFQIEDNSSPCEASITIGRFAFYQSAFEKAKGILRNALQKQAQLLIIDEIGRLELNYDGFEPLISEVIRAHQSNHLQSDLLVVVRDSLMQKVLGHFGIERFEVMPLASLKLNRCK